MKEDVFNFISATFGVSFAVALAVIILAFWLTYYITKRVTEIRSENSELNKCIHKAENNIDEIRRDMSYIKGSIDIIKGAPYNPLMQSNSPISLTELGKQVAKEIQADVLINDNWTRISKALEPLKGKNAYDIQQYCIVTADVESSLFFDDRTIDKVKSYAFNKGMPVQMYLRMLGLLIRDRFFKENDIPLNEVDNSDPNINI